MVTAVCFVPGVNDALVALPVIAHLDADIRIRVAVVEIAPLLFVEQLDEHLLVVPGRRGHVGVALFIAQKLLIVFLPLINRLALEVVLDELDGGLRLVFHALHIKGHFGADHVLGAAVFGRGVHVAVVLGTAVSRGDDDALVQPGLDVIEQIDQDGVNELLAVAQGQAVFFRSPAVEIVLGLAFFSDGMLRIEAAALAAEKFFGDGKVLAGVLLFPRICFWGELCRRRRSKQLFIVVAIDIFCQLVRLRHLPVGFVCG